MTHDDAIRLLRSAEERIQAGQPDEEEVTLTDDILEGISADEIPLHTLIAIGTNKDGVINFDWNGKIQKDEHDGRLFGLVDYTFPRKYWYAPLGLEYYMDLISRAVQVRQKTKGDVEHIHYDDDGAYVHLVFSIHSDCRMLLDAYREIRKVSIELQDVGERTLRETEELHSKAVDRLSGLGPESLESLLRAVENSQTPDEKGRALEKLTSRLLETVAGFTANSRVRTATEEIDISVLNDSNDPRFRREEALILAECKNWSGNCGKNEFVQFKAKLENRSQRCCLGVLVSWNGFAETISREMLRGSREKTLIIPITGDEIREAVHKSNFLDVLVRCWDRAVLL